MTKYKVTFVGTGMIGAGLAANAAVRGLDTTLYDVVDAAHIQKNLEKVLDMLVDAQAIRQDQKEAALNSVRYSNDLASAVEGADFVQECVPERLELKQSTYAAIQAVTGPDTVIASSTSEMFPSKLQENAQYPGSILVGHPYNPSYLLPLIEVCGGPGADPAAVEKACAVYRAMGKVPIVCRKEINGFIVNRLSWGALYAAIECIQKDICSVEDVDKAIMFGPGMRMAVTGQLLTMSLGVEGGFRKMAEKYGQAPTPYDEVLAQGVEAEIANRPPELGNTEEEVCRFRDKMFAAILREYHML